MNTHLNDNIYADSKATPGFVMHRFLWIALVLSIVVLGGVYFYIEGFSTGGNDVVPAFEKAIEDGNYDEALTLYRGVQDTVLSASPDDADKLEEENEQLTRMEEVVSKRVNEIITKVRKDRYKPSSEDVAFLGGMQELTTSIVSLWLSNLSKDFLLGKIEKPDIIFVFNQMSEISNFGATVKPLFGELDSIEMATGDVQNAERHFDDEDYITAVKTYQSVQSRYTGFVHDYSTARLEEILTVMYEPMILNGASEGVRFTGAPCRDIAF